MLGHFCIAVSYNLIHFFVFYFTYKLFELIKIIYPTVQSKKFKHYFKVFDDVLYDVDYENRET